MRLRRKGCSGDDVTAVEVDLLRVEHGGGASAVLLVGQCCPRVATLHVILSMPVVVVMFCKGPWLLLTVVLVAARLGPRTVLVVLPLLILVVGVRVGGGDARQQHSSGDCWCGERVDA